MMSPANPLLTPLAKQLLATLYDLSGKRILSGQHHYPGSTNDDENHLASLTPQLPTVYGTDFGFSADEKDGIEFRETLVQRLNTRYEQGHIVTLMWHAVPPTLDEPVKFKEHVQSKLSDAEWRELTTDGSPLNLRWQSQVDTIAGYLKQLQNLPIIWRPYHEMNGAWFWWGGRPGPEGSSKLYRMLFDRLTRLHGLNNLIWVFNPNAPRAHVGSYADYYPGHDVVDVLATDIYGSFDDSFHDDLLALAEGRPIAVGEVGALPEPDVFVRQSRYVWFMVWSGLLAPHNTAQNIQAVYSHAKTLNLQEWRTMNA